MGYGILMTSLNITKPPINRPKPFRAFALQLGTLQQPLAAEPSSGFRGLPQRHVPRQVAVREVKPPRR